MRSVPQAWGIGFLIGLIAFRLMWDTRHLLRTEKLAPHTLIGLERRQSQRHPDFAVRHVASPGFRHVLSGFSMLTLTTEHDLELPLQPSNEEVDESAESLQSKEDEKVLHRQEEGQQQPLKQPALAVARHDSQPASSTEELAWWLAGGHRGFYDATAKRWHAKFYNHTRTVRFGVGSTSAVAESGAAETVGEGGRSLGARHLERISDDEIVRSSVGYFECVYLHAYAPLTAADGGAKGSGDLAPDCDARMLPPGTNLSLAIPFELTLAGRDGPASTGAGGSSAVGAAGKAGKGSKAHVPPPPPPKIESENPYASDCFELCQVEGYTTADCHKQCQEAHAALLEKAKAHDAAAAVGGTQSGGCLGACGAACAPHCPKSIAAVVCTTSCAAQCKKKCGVKGGGGGGATGDVSAADSGEEDALFIAKLDAAASGRTEGGMAGKPRTENPSLKEGGGHHHHHVDLPNAYSVAEGMAEDEDAGEVYAGKVVLEMLEQRGKTIVPGQ